jgi:orotate phosphoribosyltransferase
MASLLVEPEKRLHSASEAKRQKLIQIISRLCLLRGRSFRLASGAQSTFYFNMKPATFDAEGSSLIAELVLQEARRDGAELVGGLEMGAVPIIACVTQLSFMQRESRHPTVGGFFVRKTPKSHGTRKLIEGLPEDTSIAGMRALIVDDVTTTGGSVLAAVEAARQAGTSVHTVVTLVDRLEGAEANLAEVGLRLIALTTVVDYFVNS